MFPLPQDSSFPRKSLHRIGIEKSTIQKNLTRRNLDLYPCHSEFLQKCHYNLFMLNNKIECVHTHTHNLTREIINIGILNFLVLQNNNSGEGWKSNWIRIWKPAFRSNCIHDSWDEGQANYDFGILDVSSAKFRLVYLCQIVVARHPFSGVLVIVWQPVLQAKKKPWSVAAVNCGEQMFPPQPISRYHVTEHGIGKRST